MLHPLVTMVDYSPAENCLRIECSAAGFGRPGHAVYIALSFTSPSGSAIIPFGRFFEGSTVFLPFRANRLFFVKLSDSAPFTRQRFWEQTMWSDRRDVASDFRVEAASEVVRIKIPLAELQNPGAVMFAVYAKDLCENDGWGNMLELADGSATAGWGDRYVRSYYHFDGARRAVEFRRHRIAADRVRIYQLMPRLFGNLNEARETNGTIAQNGVGKFHHINQTALHSLHEMGFTHLWLTGVLQQITSVDYSHIGAPADDPDLLKGLAGSPYAVKDCFDVCPDYAADPSRRLEEFRELLARIHDHGLKAIIDFVPNHVARSYRSDVRPELSFGSQDDRRRFFDPGNNFFYLTDSGPLQLPTWKDGEAISETCKVTGKCDGRFDGELNHARVTGNNVASPTPRIYDWYETVKLNYGYDFNSRTRAYPHGEERHWPLPDTWKKMDAILAFWQEQSVDGFRCDMAHMVPPEFWNWAIANARERNPRVVFIAEAYDTDPMKVPSADPLSAALNDRRGNVMFDLLSAGFDAVYDDPTYRKLKLIYEGHAWANDLQDVFGPEFIFQNSLRYAENHDEVRLAGKGHWADIGMEVGRPVSALLFGLSRGPVMLYNGQEIGEPADGAEGFGGDDARTTIFDYWSMPAFVKWVNNHRYDGGRLSTEQRDLRGFYARLIRLVGEPAFRDGEFFGLNAANVHNERFGRLPGESASGHWLFAYLRFDTISCQRFLVVVNLHRSEAFRDLHVHFPAEAITFLRFGTEDKALLVERLFAAHRLSIQATPRLGVTINEIPPLTPFFFEIEMMFCFSRNVPNGVAL